MSKNELATNQPDRMRQEASARRAGAAIFGGFAALTTAGAVFCALAAGENANVNAKNFDSVAAGLLSGITLIEAGFSMNILLDAQRLDIKADTLELMREQAATGTDAAGAPTQPPEALPPSDPTQA